MMSVPNTTTALTDTYRNPIMLNDIVCYTPYRGSIIFGKIIGFTDAGYPIINEWYRGKFITETRVVRCKWLYRLPAFPLV